MKKRKPWEKLKDCLVEATIPLAFIVTIIEFILFTMWMFDEPLGDPQGNVALTLIYGGILVIATIVMAFSFIGILLSDFLIEELMERWHDA